MRIQQLLHIRLLVLDNNNQGIRACFHSLVQFPDAFVRHGTRRLDDQETAGHPLYDFGRILFVERICDYVRFLGRFNTKMHTGNENQPFRQSGLAGTLPSHDHDIAAP